LWWLGEDKAHPILTRLGKEISEDSDNGPKEASYMLLGLGMLVWGAMGKQVTDELIEIAGRTLGRAGADHHAHRGCFRSYPPTLTSLMLLVKTKVIWTVLRNYWRRAFPVGFPTNDYVLAGVARKYS
jgi:hypothetical protein